MPDGDEGYEEEELRGPSFKKMMEVVTIVQYGNGEFDHDSRDQRGVMASGTRSDDRVIEITMNRAGDLVYRRFKFVGPPAIGRRGLDRSPEPELDSDGQIKIGPNGHPQLEFKVPEYSEPVPKVTCYAYDKYGESLDSEEANKPRVFRPKEERYFRCSLLESMQQATRYPFHMTAKWWLDKRLGWYEQLQRDNPDLLVPYPMEGLKSRRMEKSARRAIRQKLPGPGDIGYSQDLSEWRRLPDWLHKAEGVSIQDGIRLRRHLKYLVRIGDLDLRALTLLAHFDGFLENITAEQVFINMEQTIKFAKERETVKYANFAWEPPKDATNEELISWRYLFDDFLDQYYDRWYPSEQYRWREYLSDIINRYPKTPEGRAQTQEALMDLTIHVISDPKIWMDYVPFREERDAERRILRYQLRLKDPIDDNDGKRLEIQLADAKTDLRILQGSGHWEVKIDWEPFSCFVEPIEAWRDWPRMIKHWQMTKQQGHNLAAGDVDSSDTKIARRNDWGGIWQPTAYKDDWRFMKLWEWAQQVAPLPQRPMRDDLESTKPDSQNPEELWEVFASWFRDNNTVVLFGEETSALNARVHIMSRAWFWVQPEWDMPHDGVLISRLNAKRISWVELMGKYIRGQNSNSGSGVLPRFNKFVEEVLARVRNYEDEDDWLSFDEYTKRDPIDGWIHQRAIVSTAVTSEVNTRLDGVYGDSPMIHLTQDNSLSGRDFLLEMWLRQPEDPVKELLLRDLQEAEANRVTDTLKVVTRSSEGLPSKIIPNGVRLQPRHPLSLWTPRNKMELVITDLRHRAVDWMSNRAAEMGYVGGARAFTGAIFGGWLRDGFPFRIGDNDESIRLYQEHGRQSWINGIYDARIGYAESNDHIPLLPKERMSWQRAAIQSRRVNLWYGVGKTPGESTLEEHVKWISEWIIGAGVFNPHDNNGAEKIEIIARAVVDGQSYDEVLALVPERIEGKERLIKSIWQVYWTYHNSPLDV